MRKKSNITLLLIERNAQIDLTIDHNETRVLKINQKLNNDLRVVGFNKKRITQEQLLELANIEIGEEESVSQVDFIKKYIKSNEIHLASEVRRLQQNVRKIIIRAESSEIAKQLLTSLLKSQSHKLKECIDNPFEKKPHPWAKCVDCDDFYRQIPESRRCHSCGGVVVNELRPNTWFECQVCKGTGYNSRFKKVCSSCGEKGWLFAELLKL